MPDGPAISWKTTLPCTRAEAEALSEQPLSGAWSDDVPTIVTREVDHDVPDIWAIDVYSNEEPDAEMVQAISKLAPSTDSNPVVERLSDEDWVTMSQQGLEPIRAGRFYVHTSGDQPLKEPSVRNLCINAGQAFGTGHHETTMSCLETLDRLKQQGRLYRNIADIGTGTGLLAFAANHLWPRARIIASDIDQIAVDVSIKNASANGVAIGDALGSVSVLRSNGLDDNTIRRRAPYDLIIANILAGPLVALVPQFAAAAKPGTVMILAGLIERQKPEVVLAYQKAGFRLRRTELANEWPCLTMIKARQHRLKRTYGRTKSPLAEDYFGEC